MILINFAHQVLRGHDFLLRLGQVEQSIWRVKSTIFEFSFREKFSSTFSGEVFFHAFLWQRWRAILRDQQKSTGIPQLAAQKLHKPIDHLVHNYHVPQGPE